MRQRKRILSPDVLTDAELAETLNPTERLFYIGLWTIADREGRLEDKPREIKLFTMPYDHFNVDKALQKCHEAKGILERYEVKGKQYIQINPDAWAKHQSIHANEKASVLPLPVIPRNSGELPVITGLPTSSSSFTSTSTSTLTSTLDIPFDEIIEDLNSVTKREGRQKFKTGDNTKDSIRARFKDGYTLEDFKHVHRVKAQEWTGTDMEVYLNPDTLYRPTKFPKYVAQKITVKKEKPNAGHTSGKDYGPTGRTQF